MRFSLGLAILLASSLHCWSQALDLTGLWYTEGSENGQYAQFTIENKNDGTFIKHIRYATNCSAVRPSIESGKWALDDNIMTEITDTTDGEKSPIHGPISNDANQRAGNIYVRSFHQGHMADAQGCGGLYDATIA